MSHHTRSRRGLSRVIPRLSSLVRRLKRLNKEEGQAENGEDGYPGFITLDGFKKLVQNADLKSVHLPYFSPLRLVAYSRNTIKEIQFIQTSLKWAVLSHLGVDKSNPEIKDSYWDPQVFYFVDSDLDGATLDNARCSLTFIRCTMNRTNISGLNTSSDGMLVNECDAKRSNFSHSQIIEGKFLGSDFQNAKFASTTFRLTALFKNCNLNRADFSKSVFSKFQNNVYNKFENCTFVGTKFQDAVFSHCAFENCDLAGVKFGNANLSTVIFENCRNFPTTPPTKWTDDVYKTCDNEKWDDRNDEFESSDDDFEEEDKPSPDFVYKQDPISFARLRRGRGMVMIRKQNKNGDPLQPDCFNRKTIQSWYNNTQRNQADFTNPKNRDKITEDFFEENGGFVTGGRSPPMTPIKGINAKTETHGKKSRE